MASPTSSVQKMMAELLKLDGAVAGDFDPYASGIDTPSPSLNRCFDNTWLLPDGYVLLLGGEPKGGKSVILNAMTGQLHLSDPDAFAWKFNTEFREKGQLTPAAAKVWGIDRSRYVPYETNDPAQIFDRIENYLPKAIQAGMKVRLIGIDSVNDIQGRRSMNADSVMVQQIGDEAKTLKDGFKRIKAICRKLGVALVLTSQVAAEMDPVEQMRGNKVKLSVPWYVKHTAEYFAFVERLRTKEGRTNLAGEEFKDAGAKVNGREDEFGHKIRVKMMDSSVGRPGRIGIFTIDHDRGIINQHEEVFLIGVGTGVINSEKKGYYGYAPMDRNYHGAKTMLQALAEDTELRNAVLRDCKKLDIDRKNGTSIPAPRATSNEVMEETEDALGSWDGADETAAA